MHRRLLLALMLPLFGVAGYQLRAQTQEAKPFFLPQSPVAAAYVLGRLSNKELIAAPRSEFVYVALVQRKGIERKYRAEALEGLARLRHTSYLTELLRTITELDQKGASSEGILREIQPLLLQTPRPELQAQREALAKMAETASVPVTRQIAYAALLTAAGEAEGVWTAAAPNPKALADVICGIPMLRDAKLRAATYSRLEPLLQTNTAAGLQRAAIEAAPAIPGREAEAFTRLAALVSAGGEREAAVAALQKIPRQYWSAAVAGDLFPVLLAHLEGLSVERRTDSDALGEFQLATELLALLPPEKSVAGGARLRELGVSVFVIRTIREQMLYDTTQLIVAAGKPVSIVLINEDAMPHNLVVMQPGALEELGPLAETMLPEADVRGRVYVPASPKVLQATRLVEPGQQARLSFTAPRKVGEYDYACTFPGHWRLMRGKLIVVGNVAEYLATHAAPARPVMTEWKLADLEADLGNLGTQRDLAQGKALFTKLACATCHKLGNEGAVYGPELTDVFARYGNQPAEVVRQILEPALVVSNRYRGFEFELKDGDEFSGMIVKEEPDALTVQSGPAASLVRVVRRGDIQSQRAQKSSLMPTGLLNPLSRNEILDLVAYLKSGGNLSSSQN